MSWLNWSLKLQIRLRTISLLISTHNTQVCVQWMQYSFVWLFLIKCVFTCSIFFDSNIKRFLSVLGVFGKYFVFTKTEKFKKQCCPVLVTQSRVIQVACYSRELTGWFWWLFHKWKVHSRGVHSDFRGSAHDSLADHEKHLEIFFTIVTLSVLTAWPSDLLATCFSHEKRMFCVSKTVFKTFSIFPSTFCDCLLSSPFLSQLILTQTLRVTLNKLHFCIFSPPNLQEKDMSSHFLTSYLVFWTSFSWIFVLLFYLFFFFVCVCYGFVLIFEIVLVWFVEVLFLCELVSVDRFMYYHVLVSLR